MCFFYEAFGQGAFYVGDFDFQGYGEAISFIAFANAYGCCYGCGACCFYFFHTDNHGEGAVEACCIAGSEQDFGVGVVAACAAHFFGYANVKIEGTVN